MEPNLIKSNLDYITAVHNLILLLNPHFSQQKISLILNQYEISLNPNRLDQSVAQYSLSRFYEKYGIHSWNKFVGKEFAIDFIRLNTDLPKILELLSSLQGYISYMKDENIDGLPYYHEKFCINEKD